MMDGSFCRRGFLRRLAALAFFALWRPPLASARPKGPGRGFPSPSPRVAVVHHPGATDGSAGKDNVNLVEGAVRRMVEGGILAWAGEDDLRAAWRKIIPDPGKKVAIKVNCQIRGIYTKAKVVQPLVDGLLSIGVPADHIIIYDMTDTAFDLAGFRKNLGPGVKVGKVADFGGYSRFLFTRLANLLTGGYRWSGLNFLEKIARETQWTGVRRLCRLVLRGQERPYDCEYLINVPVLKALDGYSGVTLSMKNHYGSIANPGEHHDDIMDHIPLVNSLPEIRGKTRLIVLDAIFGEYRWVNGRDQSYVAKVDKILVGTDPVAIDTLGWRMIDDLRRAHNLGPVSPAPVFIEKAAAMGLGTNDPRRIEQVTIDFGAGGMA